MTSGGWDVSVFTYLRRICADGSHMILPSALAYRPAEDPFAVWVIFDPGSNEPVEWTFARELLAAGMDGPAGLGDVRIWPDRAGTLAMAMSSPTGDALFQLHRPTVAKFLRQTYASVPRGQERLDLDSELAELLNDAS